jgi:hypothetical protein
MKRKMCENCPYNQNEYCIIEDSYIDDIKMPLCCSSDNDEENLDEFQEDFEEWI